MQKTRRNGGLGRAEVPALNDSVSIPRALSERVNQLIQGIRPARASEQRRHGIADYVRRLIVKCFQPEHKVEAFMFGSVPLRTYLPDGDVDISIFCDAKGLQDTWCDKLSALLEREGDNSEAEYKVTNISLINAEVKLMKCLVDNIVVDVSFNQIGGLCTLNFLEAMDRKIGGKHLFKKSIILIKAWCYYESRVLGAQHSLLSTYALETMVLHIFNIYHSELQTPLEVLYKFLIVFHHFQWDDYCLTLSGPASLKDMDINSMPTSPEQSKTLLIPTFMNCMLDCYSYTPVVPTNSKGPGYPKYMNIMDPLLHSNNLGRSVSKTSEIRIRNAFGHGARLLNQIFSKEQSEGMVALDQFFKNTWLAQQRPRLVSQQGMRAPAATHQSPAAKTGNHILDLLKEQQHKDHGYQHDREVPHTAYVIPGYQAMMHANGNLPLQNGGIGVYPPPPPRVPDDKFQPGQNGREVDKNHSLASSAQVRRLFEAQTRPELSQFLPQLQELNHYQTNIYAAYGAMARPQHNIYQFGRGRPDLKSELQRARSAPNIGDLCPKKKEKNVLRRSPAAPYNVQNPKTVVLATEPEEDKIKPNNQRQTVAGMPARSNDIQSTEARIDKQQQMVKTALESLRLDETTLEKLRQMEARNKASEDDKGEDKKETSAKSADAAEKNTAQTSNDKPKPDSSDSGIVIGEQPEVLQSLADFQRPDRDYYSNQRQIPRRGRPTDFPGSSHPDVRTSMIPMNGQNPRQPLARTVMPDRQMQAMIEMCPNGELLPSYPMLYPYFFNAQFGPAGMYNFMAAQPDVRSVPITAHRANGIPPGGMRHPGATKDARAPPVDMFQNGYPQFQWIRPETVMDRRMTGAPAWWSSQYAPASQAIPVVRQRDEVAVRDSDDVLSGDIETLTKHLEVARNFIGSKMPSPSGEKDKAGQSSTAAKAPSPNPRKGTPSPTTTGSSRQGSRSSSRERPRNPPEPSALNQSHTNPPPAPGFQQKYQNTYQNLMCQLNSALGHAHSQHGAVPDRMTNENGLLAQLHGNVNPDMANVTYSFPGMIRGLHVPIQPMNLAPTHGSMAPMMDPSGQLPPYPPMSSPPRPQVVRSSKNNGSSGRVLPQMEDQMQQISLQTDDGGTVEIDASVLQAVRSAIIAGKPLEDSNGTLPADSSSPPKQDLSQLQMTKRQLEDGVVCYTGIPTNRPPMGGEFISGPVPGPMAHLFSSPIPATDIQKQPRISAGTGSYGTGSFIPMNPHLAAEQRKAKELPDRESQAQADSNAGEDGTWSVRSESASSAERIEYSERGHPRGRFSPLGQAQWSGVSTSGRPLIQNPSRNYHQTDHGRATNDSWQSRQDRPLIPNSGDLNEYYKDYGELANTFVTTEATRYSFQNGSYVGFPSMTNIPTNQGYADYVTASLYQLHGSTTRPQGQFNSNLNIPRNRRDGDRWTSGPRSDKFGDHGSGGEGNGHIHMRRGNDSSWEGKPLTRNPSQAMQRNLEPIIRQIREGAGEDETQQGQAKLESLFGTRQQSFRGPMNNRQHRNRRDDRNRCTFNDEEFPLLTGPLTTGGSTKRDSTPIGSPATPKTRERQNQSGQN